MKNLILSLVCLLGFSFSVQSQNCKGVPSFIAQLGFDPSSSSLRTSERKEKGMILMQVGSAKDNSDTKIYRHPSWDDAGFLGSITRDRWGNSYVAPAANVNLLYNKPLEQNNIYKVDSDSGIMKLFLRLPIVKPMTNQNPFGVLGSYYDCTSDFLFYSSVYGSTQRNEYGAIYAVDVRSKKYHTILANIDAFGVYVLPYRNKRYLVYGLTRESEIWCIEINDKNYPVSKSFRIIDLKGIGKRGDDKARKITFEGGKLTVYGQSFYYNLTAPVNIQESIYQFEMSGGIENWILQE